MRRPDPIALLAGGVFALVSTGCITAVTDSNYWEIPRGEFQRFLGDDDACRYEASNRLQPELPDELDVAVYRRCMEGHGWRRR